MGGGQDTEIPKGRETSKLSPLGGTRIAGQEGVSLSLQDKRQSPEAGNLPVVRGKVGELSHRGVWAVLEASGSWGVGGNWLSAGFASRKLIWLQ